MANENKTLMEWEASEYIHHKKNPAWYLGFAVFTITVMLVMYLLLRDLISVAVVALMSAALVIFAQRPPKTLRYAITELGIEIGDSKYPYESFKSFSVVNNHGIQSIVIDPMHRYLPPITIYFEPDDGEKIFEILSNQLPYVEYKPDFVDRFMEKIKF